MRSHWRGCKEWIDYGMPITTTSDEAGKSFDAVLTQYVGWYEDNSVGGIENSINKMIEADPNFVLGHVLKNGFELAGMSKTIVLNTDFKDDICWMEELAAGQPITSREKRHVSAVRLWADGEMTKACDVLEDILMDYPTDMLALKFAHDCYYSLSYHHQMRDSIARVLPFWKSSMPLYGYLYGMHAFGLEETYLYDEAAKQARKALEINRHDAWATHALAHVFEMTGKQDEGIEFMSKTEKEWNVCGMAACHNYWHYGIFYIEKGNFEEALEMFDTQIGRRALKSKSTMEVVNSVSYLHRLQLEDDISVGDRFNDLHDICLTHIDDHIMGYIDVHYLMACLGAGDKQGVKEITESITEFIKHGSGNTCDIMDDIGLDLCKALVAFDEENYGTTVDLLYPKRYKVIDIGGSNAQRDVFNLFLIHAALRSKERRHNKLARMLLSERKSLKENSPLTDRLNTKITNSIMVDID